MPAASWKRRATTHLVLASVFLGTGAPGCGDKPKTGTQSAPDIEPADSRKAMMDAMDRQKAEFSSKEKSKAKPAGKAR